MMFETGPTGCGCSLKNPNDLFILPNSKDINHFDVVFVHCYLYLKQEELDIQKHKMKSRRSVMKGVYEGGGQVRAEYEENSIYGY